jgi:uncharacterized protein YjbI with pentapeptide repeats
MRVIIFLITTCIVFNGYANWEKIDQDIDGEAEYNNSGVSVSLSADGTIVAIGATGNAGNGNYSGHVRVYTFNNGTWVQTGQDIDGEAASDNSGTSVSLSADGSVVAIGAMGNDGNGSTSGHVRVYTFNNGTWVQTGQDIDGEAASDYSGGSVSLNADGTVVAIGADGNDGNGNYSGHVRVYTFNNGTWVQTGQDIDGEAEYDFSGVSVSLSADGTIVAIGATGNAGNGNYSGHVRVYTFNNGTWVQTGQDIDGEAEYNNSGTSVSLSADGSVVAIGATGNAGNGTESGHVRVYNFDNDNNTWVQTGQDIDGEAEYDFSGGSVSLSADGTIVAIGSIQMNGKGQVRVYSYYNSAWVQIDQDIDGEAVGDYFGRSVSLSADGTIVAIGADGNDGNGNSSGHVRVYESSLSNDSDGDGLSDFRELYTYGTETNNIDTDGDGWGDYFEINYTFSAVRSDFDIFISSNSILSLNQELINDYSNQVALLTASNTALSAELEDIKYTDTDFTGVSFSNAVFSGADFTDAVFSNNIFSSGLFIDNNIDADFVGGSLDGSTFDNEVTWSNVVFNQARIYGAIFSNQTEIASYFTNSSIVSSDLDNVIFWENAIEGTFVGNNIDADFVGGGLDGSTFDNEVTWSNVVFNQARIHGAIFSNQTEIASYFTNSAIVSSDLDNVIFWENAIEGTFVGNNIDADFVGGSLDGSTFDNEVDVSGTTFNNGVLSSNDAHAMLDSAYVDDTVMIVSNNTASIIQVIEQSSNLTVGAWSDVMYITNTIPVDADAGFFRFKMD